VAAAELVSDCSAVALAAKNVAVVVVVVVVGDEGAAGAVAATVADVPHWVELRFVLQPTIDYCCCCCLFRLVSVLLLLLVTMKRRLMMIDLDRLFFSSFHFLKLWFEFTFFVLFFCFCLLLL
jgi:hypothetical protein